MVTRILCANCVSPITGRILQHKRANVCEACFARLAADRTAADEQTVAARERHLAAERAESQLRRLNDGPRPQTKQYKVLSQRDGFFSGRFNPERIEDAINHYAGQGWVVVSMATAAIPGGLADREELIVLLERDYLTELPA